MYDDVATAGSAVADVGDLRERVHEDSRERHSIITRAQQWRRSLTESVSTCGQYRALDVLGRRALQDDCAAATVVVVTCDTGHEQT